MSHRNYLSYLQPITQVQPVIVCAATTHYIREAVRLSGSGFSGDETVPQEGEESVITNAKRKRLF